MNAWSVLIGTLADKPENHETPPRQRTDPRPDVQMRMAKLKGASEAEVLKVIDGLMGAATAENIREFMPHRSYKYICALCRRLELDSKLTSYIKVEGRSHRKYWKLV
jgi:hypothetical protein